MAGQAAGAKAMKRAPLFICEHGKRDDEDCLRCEIEWEERMIAVDEDRLSKSKAKLAALLARSAIAKTDGNP